MVTQSATILERHLMLAGEPPPPLQAADFHKLAAVLNKRKTLTKEVITHTCVLVPIKKVSHVFISSVTYVIRLHLKVRYLRNSQNVLRKNFLMF